MTLTDLKALEQLWLNMKQQPSAFDQQDLQRVEDEIKLIQKVCSKTEQLERILQQRQALLEQCSVLSHYPHLLDFFVTKQTTLTQLLAHDNQHTSSHS